MMRLSPLFVLLLGATSSLAQGQPQAQAGPSGTSSGASLTLAQAEATALRSNPQITIGRLRALEAQQYVREKRSALLPTAYLSLTGVDSEAGSRIAAGALNNPILFSRAAAGATVNQLVTDFGRTTNLVSSSQFQAKAEDKNAGCRSGVLQRSGDP
jgi:outer membrane protein